MMRKIHFGCGDCAPSDWDNYDSSPTLLFQRLPIIGRLFRGGPFMPFPIHVRRGNIAKGLPVAPQTANVIYCSHVLEHLSLQDIDKALANIYSYLVPGGIFRLVMPDLEFIIQKYVSATDPEAAARFMVDSHLGKRNSKLWTFLLDWCGHQHRWLWDFKGIEAKLADHGFAEIRRAVFADAETPEFNDVELQTRWQDSLGIECRRPR